MKSFTVTFHHTCNYGATLQAYALQRVMNLFGTENTLMEYADYHYRSKSRSIIILIRSKIYGILQAYRQNEIQKLKQSFDDFHKKYLMLSKQYQDMKDLRENAPDAEILICGSDQVWNLKTNPEMLPARFLVFGRPDAIRFSYAASIGVCKYSDKEKQQVAEYLNHFKGISLRERSATEFISKISGKECETVCDPVLLLEKTDWKQIAKKRKVTKNPFILCYCVQGNERLSEVVKRIKKQTGYDVVFIHCDAIKRCNSDYHLFDVSPEEFLGLYCDASIVITTSFHGTAFALEFGKPVFALVRGYDDTRISDLMEYVGLSEFIIREGSSIPKVPDNIKDAEKEISKYRKNSLKYIKRMIDDKKEPCNRN